MTQDTPKQTLRQTIGAAARDARKHLGLTQEDVADRLGIATEVYGRLERGAMSPSVHSLRKLCLVLNLSADRMLGTSRTAGAPLEDTSAPPVPDSRHMRRLLRRARRLTPQSLRLLAQLASQLPKKSTAASKPARG